MPSATPGFLISRKIDVQFVEAAYDDFLTKAEAKVTDEEVAKYYEEHGDSVPEVERRDHCPGRQRRPTKDAQTRRASNSPGRRG